MTAVHTVPAVTAARIADGSVTVITAAERGSDGRVLIRADTIHMGSDEAMQRSVGVVVKPGHIVASGTVEWVPIWRLHRKGKYVYSPGRGQLRIVDALERQRHITDQLPYGDFTPGRWAGILTDVKATTDRCPACWGTGWICPAPLSQGGHTDIKCRPCRLSSARPSGCPPIACDNVSEWP